MTIKQLELNMLYALLKRQEDILAAPLLSLLAQIERHLYQSASIDEMEKIAKMDVYRVDAEK